MSRLIGLRRGSSRSGVDAFYDFSAKGNRYSTPIELKSTTTRSVSTARDVGPKHIAKWRSRVWIFGFYDSSGSRLESLLALGTVDMEPWIARIESYIAPDIAIGERVAERLDMEDLHTVLGEKEFYGLEDAQLLHKRQWSKNRYLQESDQSGGYSPQKMLEILKLRARYLNTRGSTLNNPHIPASYWAPFEDRELSGQDPTVKASVRAAIRSLTLGDRTLRATSRALARHY